ncbi:FitA-like ribbon-helix-helix domain-containing protein [Pseudonocardia nigra]|uniref:FitA-like ribbon-helix-helix domain-containing protein n=1 Tax=Pseudonocardia nigra TaxID=1921578 RepID=UPI001C5F6403|nr:hypothetical protein [Pseudonocardia nigra]
MADLLIRDLDPEAHRELKRRAEREGQSLQSYVAHVLQTHASRPPLLDWLSQLDEVEPVLGATGADAVTAARDDLP